MSIQHRPLTHRQRRFVEEYLVDLNGAAAARRAGYSHAAAPARAFRLLRKPRIRAVISAETDRRACAARVKAASVVGELARVAFFDPARLLDDKGAPLPLDAVDPDVRAGIGAFELIERGPTDRGPAERRLKAKPGEKVRALLALAKLLGPAASDTRQWSQPERRTPQELAEMVAQLLLSGINRQTRVEDAADERGEDPEILRPNRWNEVMEALNLGMVEVKEG